MKERLETGRYLFKMSLSSVNCFKSGMTIAFFVEHGTVPVSNEMLIIFVVVGSIVGEISIKNPAGIGSKAHDFLGFLLIILDTSSSVAGLNVSKEISEYLLSEIHVEIVRPHSV